MDRILSKQVGFARDVILINVTEIKDSLGNITAVTESTSTIEVDFQPITKQDHQIIERGIANMGDAKVFCRISYTINPDDFISVDGVRWQFLNQIEPDDVEGVQVCQSWVVRRFDG